MQTLIIDRKKWRTGGEGEYKTGEGDTYLRNYEGYMCCLGFECIRRGLMSGDILEIGEPSDILGADFPEGDDEVVRKLGSMLTLGQDNSDWVLEAMHVNDDIETTLLEKEILVTQIFLEQGINVQFKN